MSDLLLTTKLGVPPLRPGLVPRPRLIERMDEALGRGRGAVLILAPAGFGKTTLLAEWLRHLRTLRGPDLGIAWLDLDEDDGDPARFFTYLVAALRSIDPTVGAASRELLASGEVPPQEALLTALVNEIALIAREFVLAIDDYHLTGSVPVHRQLAFLIDHGPPQMHLALASREDPPLPLGRLRASGRIVEIRQADLEFTPAEAAALVRGAAKRALSDADVSALRDYTEGWAAGLQLAALALRDQDDVSGWLRRLAGSQRFVLDYLMEQVFGRQPADVQDFLLSTSILDRFTGSLCDAVCVSTTGHDTLMALERANLFLVPLDESRLWYRYHRLFGDVLRHRLQSERPERVTELHRRASRWYVAHGYPADAVRHALAGSDWDGAADLVLGGTGAGLLERGELLTLLRWFRAFPEPVVRASARLCCEYAWPLLLTGQSASAEAYLDEARAIDSALVERFLRERNRAFRQEGGEPAPGPMGGLAALAPDRLPGRDLILLNLGMSRWYQGRLPEAEAILEEARNAAREGGSYPWVAASIFLNRVEIARGGLRQGEAAIADLARRSGRTPIAALAHYDLGVLDYEWNELAAAADHVIEGLQLCAASDCGELGAAGHSTLARIRQAQGLADVAEAELRLAGELHQSCGPSPAGRLYHLTVRILVSLAKGDVDAASAAVGQIPAPKEAGSVPDYLPLCLAHASYLLARGRRKEAAERSAAVYASAHTSGWRLIAMAARALQAIAAPRIEEALPLLAEALAEGDRAGCIRSFVDSGEPMRLLIGQALARGIRPEYAGRLLRAFGQIGPGGRRDSGEPLVRPLMLTEAISPRELEVLRLLAGGLTNEEIAGRLFLSLNTVKTHLASVYGKLCVSSRRAAVVAGRQAGLLP